MLEILNKYLQKKRFTVEKSAEIEWLLVSSGSSAWHDNVILFGYEPQTTEPSFVVKASRLPENDWMLQNEYEHLEMMWRLLNDQAPKFLPQPLAFELFSEQPVLITNFLPGASLHQIAEKNFWKQNKQVKALMVAAGSSLRRIHELSAIQLGFGETVISDFERKARTFQQMFSLTDIENQAIEKLLFHLSELSETANRKTMIQGDFWHGNLIKNDLHDQLMIVDWQFARWATDTSFDVYLFPLAAAITAAPSEPDHEKAQHVLELLCQWKDEILPSYFESYGKPVGYTLLSDKDGFLLSCIEKAARSMTDFGYRHPDDMLWRNLFQLLINWLSPCN